MDPRTQNPQPHFLEIRSKKREQKFLHFAFEPGDEELMAQLPQEQQTALRSDGSYADRAQKQGIAIGTVRSRLHRARAALTRLRECQKQDDLPDSSNTQDAINQSN